MKRYILFSGCNYYPGGGWEDHIGDYDDIRDAADKGREEGNDWFHVVDTATGEVVIEG